MSNRAPELLVQERFEITVNQTLTFTVVARDPEGKSVRIGVSGLPTGAQFVETNGVGTFTWSPIVSDVGASTTTYRVTFSTSDGHTRVEQPVEIVVAPENSRPALITPSGYVLDLKKEGALLFDVEFRDNDSPAVALTLLEGPSGAQFVQVDTKLARFGWQPTPEQVRERQVYGVTVQAYDGQNDPVVVTILIFLVNGPTTTICQGTPPTLLHTPLPNQSGQGPFPLLVTIDETDSSIREARLFYTTQAPDSAGLWSSLALSSGDGVTFTGQIPAQGPEVTTVYYYICATDDDDSTSTTCDHRRCIPEASYFQFTVGGN
ncbi:MAG: hypothetical protein KC609_04695 [Myxococcales bacterium]|nr:hypothetical protein [Myxococcales bacterium]